MFWDSLLKHLASLHQDLKTFVRIFEKLEKSKSFSIITSGVDMPECLVLARKLYDPEPHMHEITQFIKQANH